MPVEPASIVNSIMSAGADHAKPRSIELADLHPGAFQQPPLFSWSRRYLRAALYVLLVLADVAAIFAGFALGSFIRHGDFDHWIWLSIATAATPLFIASGMHNGAYSLAALQSTSVGIRRATWALASSFAMLFVFSYFLKTQQDISRVAIASGAVLGLAMILFARVCLGRFIRRISAGLTATVVIADDSRFAGDPGSVIIDALHHGIRPEPRNPAMVQRFCHLIQFSDRVIVACPREARAGWAEMLKGANVCGEILTEEVQAMGAVGIGRCDARATLVVSPGPMSMQRSFFKRAFDICLAVPLLIFFAPLLVAVAIAIKLDSPGPVLFRQPRVGFGNRMFDIYKFRSMATAANDRLGTRSTTRDDARLTRLGRFIRRTSIDELPQLFNVLGGSMSLVGPRPHALGSCAGPALFWDIDDRYARRHLLKPGMTGLAQVRGYRGTAHEPDDLSRRLQADLEYINDWTIWRDVVLLLKTLSVVVHPNAY